MKNQQLELCNQALNLSGKNTQSATQSALQLSSLHPLWLESSDLEVGWYQSCSILKCHGVLIQVVKRHNFRDTEYHL